MIPGAVSSALSTLRWIPFAQLFLLTTLLALTALICRNVSVLPFKAFYQSSPKPSLSWILLSHSYVCPSGTDTCFNREKSTVDPSHDLQNLFQPQHPVLVLPQGCSSWVSHSPVKIWPLFPQPGLFTLLDVPSLRAGGNLWSLLPTILLSTILLPDSCLSFGERCFPPLFCHFCFFCYLLIVFFSFTTVMPPPLSI